MSSSPRYAAVDVHYPASGGAVAAVVVAADPAFAAVIEECTAELAEVEGYRPGAFFTRELPAIGAVLARTDPVDVLIVDGYVDLDPHGRPGLGAHAYAAFAIPVIGVAKTRFHSATHAVHVIRGKALRPLYVTAAAMPVGEAAELVQNMTGPYRLPDALRRVDALCRAAAPA